MGSNLDLKNLNAKKSTMQFMCYPSFFQGFVCVVATTKLGRSSVFVVIFEHISHLVLVLLCFTLNR